MLGSLKALAVILPVGIALFLLFRRAFADRFEALAYQRLGLAWVVVTTSAFLAPSIWVYLLALGAVSIWAPAGSPRPAAARVTLWLGLLLAVPNVPVSIAGFGGIANLFPISHVRALTLFLLLPAVLAPADGDGRRRFGTLWIDWCVLGYVLLGLWLNAPHSSATSLARMAFLQTLDMVLPYWALSRCLSRRGDMQSALLALVVTGMIVAALAAFETLKAWPIFVAVEQAWGSNWGMSIFLRRGDFLRAQGALGHSLVMGYCMVVLLGLWLWARTVVRQNWVLWIGWLVLLGGLWASLARGAWLGAVLLVVLLFSLGRRPLLKLAVAAGTGGGAVLAVLTVPLLEPVVRYLPFLGDIDSQNIEYRTQLFEVSMALLQQSPWFGVPGYMSYMEELRQGQGIIDIVNSYIAVALGFGLVGLSMFLGAFLGSLVLLWRVRQKFGPQDEAGQLAIHLIAIVLAVMAVIATVSSINVVPILYWSLVGLGVTCWRLYVRQGPDPTDEEAPRRRTLRPVHARAKP